MYSEIVILAMLQQRPQHGYELKKCIEQALGGYFDLAGAEVRELIAVAEAERREAVDLHQFTSLIIRHYDEGQRYVLAELLWRVVLADGELSRHEDTLLVRLGRLLDLRPGYLAGIRKNTPER